jgi:6-methylpretetramide 4-monooxygenase / 4-hydroxy-6-methylpretetramide 12a-monooxygenase
MPDLNRGDEPILVVGAGPAGLTAAHELARHGAAVRIVDAAPGPATTSRAIATHARTLETYDQMGVLGDMLARGHQVDAFSMHRRGRRMVRFGPQYDELPTRFPYTLLIEQTSTEAVLRKALARRGVQVEWGLALTGIRDAGDGAVAELRDQSGSPVRVAAPWVVGCDGGHSTMRKLLELPLIGDVNETWLIADAVVDTAAPRDSLHWLKVRGGTVMAVPLPSPGKWRLLDTVDIDGASDPEKVASRFSRKLRNGLGGEVRVHTPSWVSVFTIQQRMIPEMRVGRCFVAGDAAHVHSPASGQGMNTGIQDAFNLAWKLANVTHGVAAEALLDSYAAERVPIGRALLGATKKATALVALKSSIASAAMPAVFTVVRSVPAIRHRIERKIMHGMTGLAIAYPQSPLTVPSPDAPRPRPGDRVTQVTPERVGGEGWSGLVAELRDPRWTLLVFPGAGDDGCAVAADELATRHPWLSVRLVSEGTGAGWAYATLADPDGALAHDLGAGPGDWLLIRPDAYLSARGGGPGGLRAAVESALERATLDIRAHVPATEPINHEAV